MKRSHIWGLISLGVFVSHLLFVFLVLPLDAIPKDNEIIMFYAFWGFFFGLIPLGIAGYYSRFKEGDRFDWSFGTKD